MSQHHYQNKSWTDRNCHAVWRFWMNSVDLFAVVKMHRKHYRSCVTHLCTSRTTSNKPLSNGWLAKVEHGCDSGSEILEKVPATWHLTFSWWKTWSKFRCCRKYRTIGSRISSLYLRAFNVPSVFFLGLHYHWICHQLNIYWMNSVDVFAAVKIHRKHYRSCVTYLCTSRTTSNKPLSNGWL
jgi:hypothetical protein